MHYNDIQTLLLNEIKAASEPDEAGKKPLFETPDQTIIRYFVSEKKPRLTPAALFRKISPEERQLIKYFLLLLVIEHREQFENINNDCLFMRILNTQRKSCMPATPGKTQSSRHFNWITGKKITWDRSTLHFKPFVPHTETTKPCPAADLIFQRANTLMTDNKNLSHDILQFLIYLHDQQCLTQDQPTLNLLSEAFLLLADHTSRAYCETSSPNLLSLHLDYLIRSDFLSPKQDMANVIDCLKNPFWQAEISQHPNAYLLFSRLYHLLPLKEQRPVLLAWLANTNRFKHHLAEIHLQVFLLNTAYPGDINHDATYSPLTKHCIDYLTAKNNETRNAVKQALKTKTTPESTYLRVKIQLMEGGPSPDVNLDDLDDSDIARRLKVNFHYEAFKQALKASEQTHADLKTLEATQDEHQQAALSILTQLIKSPNTPTLSQLETRVTLLTLLTNKNGPDTHNLQLELITRDDILKLYYGTAEYQFVAEKIGETYENKLACLAHAIHLRPFFAPYYYHCAKIARDHLDLTMASKSNIEYLRLASKQAYPNEETTPDDSNSLVSVVFSKDLTWLDKHLANKAGQLHRGALAHWQRLHTTNALPPDNALVTSIKTFYTNDTYDTLKTLIEGWPEEKKHERFDALLALAQTVNKWRCYKVLFSSRDLLDEKNARDIYNLVAGLPEKRLLKRALLLCKDPKTVLSQKLAEYKAQLETLKNSLSTKSPSITNVGQFQPFDNNLNKRPDGAPILHNRF